MHYKFLFGHGIYIPWSDHSHWTEILSIEIILMSLVIGGVSTSMIMLGTFISKIIDSTELTIYKL